jgi:hypothetical protein
MKTAKTAMAITLALIVAVMLATGCSKPAVGGDGADTLKAGTADNGLAAPDGIEAVAVEGSVTISWSAVNGALKYDVYGAGVHIVTTDTKYTFDSLAPGEYNVRVMALGGPKSSEAKVTFVFADSGAVETTAVDVPETKTETKSESKSDNTKTDTSTKTDKAKSNAGGGNSSSTGNSNTGSGNNNTGNSNSGSGKDTGKDNSGSGKDNGNSNNANTGNSNGGGTGNGTGGGADAGGTTTPPADPNAGKTWIPEQVISHPAVEGLWGVVGQTDSYPHCTKCEFKTRSMDEMEAHMFEFGHGYRVIPDNIEGWLREPKAAWTETVPGHWA